MLLYCIQREGLVDSGNYFPAQALKNVCPGPIGTVSHLVATG